LSPEVIKTAFIKEKRATQKLTTSIRTTKLSNATPSQSILQEVLDNLSPHKYVDERNMFLQSILPMVTTTLGYVY
jgi:hypothetical protein